MAADKKTSQLNVLLSPSNGDVMQIVNAGETKQIDYANLAFLLLSGGELSGNLTIDSSVLKVGDATNYLQVAADGSLTLFGTATTWDDLRVPVTATRVGPLFPPDFAQFRDDGAGSTGVFTFLFSKVSEEQIYFSVQLPHTWKEGSLIYPHAHWSPIDTDTGSVTWGLEYVWSNINGTFGNTTIVTATQAADGTAYKHQLAGFSAIDGTGQTHSSMLICRLFRDVDNNDDYDNDAALLEVDFHYEINSLGDDTLPG